MINYLVDIFPIILFVIFALGIKAEKPFNDINEEYLSRKTTTMAKGAFAVTVVLHHLYQNLEVGYILQVYMNLGTVAVAVFFFYSGYGLQKNFMANNGYKSKFLLKRLPSILFPYIVMCVIYLIYDYLTGEDCSVKTLFIDYIKGDYIVTYAWFIINILLFYIAFYISMLIYKRNYMVMVFSLLIVCILYTYMCMKMGFGSWRYASSYIFIVGMFWAIKEKEIYTLFKKYYNFLVLPIFIALVVIFLSNDNNYEKFIAVKTGIMNLLFVIALNMFVMKFSIGNRILTFFGNISLELYLIQGLMIRFFRSDYVFIDNDFTFMVVILSTSIIAAALLHSIFSVVLKKYKNMLSSKAK